MERKNTVINARYFYERFPDNESAMAYLDSIRWNGACVCPRCGHAIKRKQTKRKTVCSKCYNTFSATYDTLFHGTMIPLRSWFLAAYHMMRPEGTNTNELGCILGMDRMNARLLMHRIGAAMGGARNGAKLKGIVECDEAVFGGLEICKHPDKRLNIGSGFGGKAGAVCMVERGGRAITLAVPNKPIKTRTGENTTTPDFSREMLRALIREHVDPSAIIVTDGKTSYGDLVKAGLARVHFKVIHSEGEYVIYPDHPEVKRAHTNTVESRWSALKARYRKISNKIEYLQHHLDAADFQWNETRVFGKDGKFMRRTPTEEAFEKFVRLALSKRIKVRDMKATHRKRA